MYTYHQSGLRWRSNETREASGDANKVNYDVCMDHIVEQSCRHSWMEAVSEHTENRTFTPKLSRLRNARGGSD